MVEPPTGIEPATCRLQGGCSAKLSYGGEICGQQDGIEPSASALRERRSGLLSYCCAEYSVRDSNPCLHLERVVS